MNDRERARPVRTLFSKALPVDPRLHVKKLPRYTPLF